MPLDPRVVRNYSLKWSQPTRTPEDVKNERISIGKRIKRGKKFFDRHRFKHHLPGEKEDTALFLTLLHANLPLYRVANVESSKGGDKVPDNATWFEFLRAYQPAFPRCKSLWDWQVAAEKFLERRIPPKRRNWFKWRDTRRPDNNWTLTDLEISRIAYDSTHQFARTILQ